MPVAPDPKYGGRTPGWLQTMNDMVTDRSKTYGQKVSALRELMMHQSPQSEAKRTIREQIAKLDPVADNFMPVQEQSWETSAPVMLPVVGKKEVTSIPVKTTTGLVRDEAYQRARLTTKIERRLDTLSQLLGVQIQFLDRIDTPQGEANASYKDGVIALSLNAEDPVMTSVLHEAVHHIKKVGGDGYASLEDLVRQNLGEPALKDAMGVREILYGTSDETALSEEMVADAVGRLLNDSTALDRLSPDDRSALRKVADFVHDLIIQIDNAISGSKKTLSDAERAEFADLRDKIAELEQTFIRAAQDTPKYEEETGEGRNSLKRTTDGRPVVVVNDNILANATNDKDIISIVRASLGRFDRVPISGQTIYFTTDTKNEYTRSKYTQKLHRKDSTIYTDKMRLAGHPLDIIYATTDYINEAPKHQRKDDIIDFARGSLLMDVDGRKYEAEVVIGFTKAGVCELHDVVKLTPTTFEYTKVTGTPGAFGETSPTRQNAPVTANTIAKTAPIVNPSGQNSLKGFDEAARAYREGGAAQDRQDSPGADFTSADVKTDTGDGRENNAADRLKRCRFIHSLVL